MKLGRQAHIFVVLDPASPVSVDTLKVPVLPAVKLAAAERPASGRSRHHRRRDRRGFGSRAQQLKFTRCPHSLTAPLAALPSMSLIPFAPFAAIAADLKV